MDLPELIQTAVKQSRFAVSVHGWRRLRDRKLKLWQIEVGVDGWNVLEERPDDVPNPSIVAKQLLADGSEIEAVWAWNAIANEALLVTVYFPY